MLNRLLVFVLVTASPMGVLPTVVHAQSQTQVPAAAPATAQVGPPPVCGLEGEIGTGRGRIEARGTQQGYVGELSLPLNAPADASETTSAAQTPRVVLKVRSIFAPHKPAVDRISLEIGGQDGPPGAASPAPSRLSGTFGVREGGDLNLTRGGEVVGSDTAWFDALLSGQTVTATQGEGSVEITYSADQFASDYDFLLDLLQLTAGWELRGLCVNRSPS